MCSAVGGAKIVALEQWVAEVQTGARDTRGWRRLGLDPGGQETSCFVYTCWLEWGGRYGGA